MSERFWSKWNGWELTIFMISFNLWAYQARKENDFFAGSVEAENRIDALHRVIEEVG